MSNIYSKEEGRIIEFMITLYCRKNHKDQFYNNNKCLCSECTELYDYVQLRMDKCPRKDVKTFCASCPRPCYKPDMKERIRIVMKFSGPRMLLYNPRMAMLHVVDTIKHKKKK